MRRRSRLLFYFILFGPNLLDKRRYFVDVFSIFAAVVTIIDLRTYRYGFILTTTTIYVRKTTGISEIRGLGESDRLNFFRL